eukprot:668691-Pleurochrysis_carterae.AAC.3
MNIPVLKHYCTNKACHDHLLSDTYIAAAFAGTVWVSSTIVAQHSKQGRGRRLEAMSGKSRRVSRSPNEAPPLACMPHARGGA